MRLALRIHPHSRCDALTGIEVETARPGPGTLMLRYFVKGEIGNLSLPAAAAPGRADGLWRHGCFEAFVRAGPGPAYYELHCAPSRQWAAYRFDGYRSGMRAVDGMSPPRLETRSSGALYELRATLDVGHLPGLAGGAPWRLGLAAVIEEAGGRLSYWALAHPPGRPDFHHGDCLVHELPVAERP